jgi:hypothetical protein
MKLNASNLAAQGAAITTQGAAFLRPRVILLENRSHPASIRDRLFRRMRHRTTPDTQHGLWRGAVMRSFRKQRADAPR